MKTLNQTNGTFYFVFDIKTKAVLVTPRECKSGVITKYDDSRVAIMVADTLAELNSIIETKTY